MIWSGFCGEDRRIGKTGHKQNGQAGPPEPTKPGNLETVHAGHNIVHDHEIDPVALPV